MIPAVSNMVDQAVEVKGNEPTPKTLPEVQNPMENVDELKKPAACSNPSDMQKEMDMVLQSVIYEPQAVDGTNDTNPKRVSFFLEGNQIVQIADPEKTDEQIVATLVDMQNATGESGNLADLDTDDGFDNLVIDERADIDVNLNILDTGFESDDTEIVDDVNVNSNVEDDNIESLQEIPCLQMVHQDPYAKKHDSDIVKDAQVNPVDDPDKALKEVHDDVGKR